MPPLILPLYDPAGLAPALANGLATTCIAHELRSFPDGETYLRINTDVSGRDVTLLAALDRPDAKITPLLIAADALRNLGVKHLTLLAPYLPYMRQDKQFSTGEAITSRTFASLISSRFDKLITIDPHLHRYKALSDLYTCTTCKLDAAPLLAKWVGEHVEKPFLIGPDSESQQWVSAIAEEISAPFDVLAKTRHGDYDVTISDLKQPIDKGTSIILIDDTISTATTMCEAVSNIIDAGYEAPICCAVHGIFSDTAYDKLLDAGATAIVSTNTVPHISNQIDISKLLISALAPKNRAPDT